MTLKVHHLRPAPGAKSSKKRVGRGEGGKGGKVTVDALVEMGAVRKGYPVKVLGNGELSVALQVSADAYTASAKEKIEKAGGTADEL